MDAQKSYPLLKRCHQEVSVGKQPSRKTAVEEKKYLVMSQADSTEPYMGEELQNKLKLKLEELSLGEKIDSVLKTVDVFMGENHEEVEKMILVKKEPTVSQTLSIITIFTKVLCDSGKGL